MDAAERAATISRTKHNRKAIAEQIRQAEQAARQDERRKAEKPSDAIDLGPTEEKLNSLAQRIEDTPFGNPYVVVDHHEAVLLRGIVATAKSNYDAFYSLVETIPKIKQDERRKVLERCAGICKQHAINAERRAAGHMNTASIAAAKDKQEAHEHDEATIRALAEEVTP